ncbi:MAG: hypothetical protein AAF449_02820 [Myxococcota bacterium]
MLKAVMPVLMLVGQPVSLPDSSTSTPERSSLFTEWLLAAEVAIGQEDAKKRIRSLEQRDPSSPFVGILAGLEALHRGDLRTASTRLPAFGDWTPFAAMAELHSPGGLARARGMLAAAARASNADASTLFMAALAYAQLERMEPADRLLQRAVAVAERALDAAFAPDPAVAIAQLLVKETPPDRRTESKLRMAEALAQAGRRGAARRMVSKLTGARAARVRWLTWDGVDRRRAVAAARAAASARTDMALVVAEDAFERGEAVELPTAGMPDAVWQARLDRLRASVALKQGRATEALDAARAAARQDPSNAAGISMVVQAMLAAGEVARADAFAEVLLERRPIDVNPYDGLLAVRRARAPKQTQLALMTRQRAWQDARATVERARARRERLLGAVRDADSGLKATGLAAARAADPTLGLPLDIALAKYGRAGTSRAARDRILAACGRHFRDWLARRGDWAHVKVTVSPYRKSRMVKVALSDADPGRCPPLPLKARHIRSRRRP